MKSKKKAKKDRGAGKSGGSNGNGILRTPFLISIGALALAEEQASNMIDSFIERGEKARKAGEKYLKKLNDNAPEAPKKPKKPGKKQEGREDWILRALHWLNVPTRDDIEELNKKVEALMKKVA